MNKRAFPLYAMAAYLFAGLASVGLWLLLSLIPGFGGWPDGAGYLTSMLLELLLFGLPVALWYEKSPETRPLLRWRPARFAACATTCMAAMVGVPVLSLLTSYMFRALTALGLSPAMSSIAAPANGAGFAALLLTGACTPAVCEELFFRGMLMPSLERYGRRRALFFSALLFAAAHGEVEGLPAYLILGVLLGALAQRSGSLLLPILFHLVHNGVSLYVLYASSKISGGQSAGFTDAQLLETVPTFLLYGALWAFLLWQVLRKRPQADNPPPDALPERPDKWAWALAALCLLYAAASVGADLLPLLS